MTVEASIIALTQVSGKGIVDYPRSVCESVNIDSKPTNNKNKRIKDRRMSPQKEKDTLEKFLQSKGFHLKFGHCVPTNL